MAEEQVFTVEGALAQAATLITLSEAGLREREHLQEWVLANPSIIGRDVIVVTTEFDRWLSARGGAPLDRLDVLALDRSGRLVVAELKRDRAPDTVDMQALKYAAMASRFSLDTLASAFAAYTKKREGIELTPSEALSRLQDWAPDLSDETLRSPRISLIAGAFPPSVAATTVFLHENGLDISLSRVQAYRTTSSQVMITVSQLWPIPTAEDFTISPRSSSQAKQQVARERKQRASIVDRIIGANALKTNEPLRIIVPPNVGQEIEAIQRWLDQEESRARCEWTGHGQTPIRWVFDGQPYTAKSLIFRVIQEATQQPPKAQVWGPNWFQTEEGKTLAQLGSVLPDP